MPTQGRIVEPSAPRVTSIMGVARALLSTVDERETVEVLVAEFGWDLTFQALALLRGEHAEKAFALAWEHLVTADIAADLDDLPGRTGPA